MPKKYFKILISVFILSLIFMILPLNKAEALIPEEAKKSVVRIVCEPFNSKGIIWGSGFAIGEGEPIQYVITNFHVIQGNPDELYLFRSKDVLIKAEVAISMPKMDLAVLKLEKKLYKIPPLALANSSMVNAMDRVYVLGFPWTSDALDGSFTGLAEDVALRSAEIGEKSIVGDRKIYKVNGNLYKGNSGGPLLNENCQVIGVNTFGLNDGEDKLIQGVFASVQIDEILEPLEEQGVKFMNTSAVSKSQSSNSEINKTEEQQKSNSNKYLYIVPILIFAAAAAAVVITIQKNKIDKSKSYKDSKSKEEVGNPVLIGVNGYFNGKRIKLDSNPITIGRDPSVCQLLYNSEAWKISRKHCSIKFDSNKNKFILIDYSSNGTFLYSGKRLVKGQLCELMSGENFYLSDNSNMFEVRLEK